jgi:hypothetical protein
LLSPVIPEDENGNNGKNLDAIDNILHFLDDQITKNEVREFQLARKNLYLFIFSLLGKSNYSRRFIIRSSTFDINLSIK